MEYSDEQNFSNTGSLDNERVTPAPANEIQVRKVFLFFAIFWLLCLMLAGIVTQLLQSVAGWDMSVLAGEVTVDSPASDLWKVRFTAAMNQFLVILMPAVITVYALRRQILNSIGMQYAPSWKNVASAIGLIIVSTPLVLYIFEWNRMIPMPDWMQSTAERANETIKAIMQMPTSLEFIANLSLIALLPAVGEELMFRGLIQRQLMRRMNPWTAIVITGALFSLFHLQMDGFFPRWLLGIVLGWLYWRSGSFWVPVAAHFFNNAIQVAAQFFYAQQLSNVDLEQDVHIPLLAAVVSAVGVYLWMRFSPITPSVPDQNLPGELS